MKFFISIIPVPLLLFLTVFFSHAQPLSVITDTVITEFGVYKDNLVSIIPNSRPYTIEAGLTNVNVPSNLVLSSLAQEKIAANGFVVSTSRFAQMHDLYHDARNKEIPLFITTDALLHTFHILFDYTLRMMEISYFSDAAGSMTDMLLEKIEDYKTVSTNPFVLDILGKNTTYLSVAGSLFNPGFIVPAGAQETVSAELQLILNDNVPYNSPLFGYIEDYSQYIPRGHYTRNETLERYFRGMMWYGRMMFRLKDDTDPSNIAGRRETLQALYLVKALREARGEPEDAVSLWGRVYYPTVFFVGKTDDLTGDDYLPLVREVYGKTITSLTVNELADETNLNTFIDRALELRNPMINSSWVGDWQDFQNVTKGFRLMGQRFIPDSYMFHKLTHDKVADRYFPRGLDVMAVLGSERALSILDDYYNQSVLYADYLPKLEELRGYFHELTPQAWAQNLYWNWLYVLDPLLWVKGTGYPFFMQNEAWQNKDLSTALASWAELRHDTILYAKQSYTELTGVLPEVNPEKGYVEPNPHFFARLAALADFMRNGITSRDLALEVFDKKLRDMEELSLALMEISVKELMNIAPDEDEFQLILQTPPKLEDLVTFPPEIAGQFESDTDDKMAVVADVHTDPNSLQVLEEGVGYPMPIYVVCPVDDRLVLAQGAVFSYYEFTHPLNDRLTDEAWQEMLANGTQPEQPAWTEVFRDISQGTPSGIQVHLTAHPLVTSIEEPARHSENEAKTTLMQNYPNPGNPQTSIWYHLESGGPFRVHLGIYNILGQEVRTLVNELQAGDRPYLIVWDGKDNFGTTVSSGVYIYILRTEIAAIARKLVIMR